MHKFVRIEPLKNGAHDYVEVELLYDMAEYDFGDWALIPKGMDTPNFPFGQIEVEMAGEEYTVGEECLLNGSYIVTKWTAKPIQEATVTDNNDLRERAYVNERCIYWYGNGKQLTVAEATTIWLLYASEGNSRADDIKELIKKAKNAIRDRYPV